jgi:hypothetical protein
VSGRDLAGALHQGERRQRVLSVPLDFADLGDRI